MSTAAGSSIEGLCLHIISDWEAGKPVQAAAEQSPIYSDLYCHIRTRVCAGHCEISEPLAPLEFSYTKTSQANGKLLISQADLEAAFSAHSCFGLNQVMYQPEIAEYT